MEKIFEKYMRGLGYKDVADFTEDVFRGSWSGGYSRWRVLKPVIKEMGWDLATEEGYAKFLPYTKLGFNMTPLTDQAMQEMGIKEIKDIPTMGRVLKHIWHDDLLCPTEIAEESSERVVLRTIWCGNPAYGPSPFGAHDCICHYHEYYRNYDGGLTRDLGLVGMAEEAKKRGLKEDIEVEMPWAMCRDGDAPYCLMVLRKKGTSKYEPPALTDREKAWFIGQKIEESGEKPMVFVAKMLGKTIDELALAILILYVGLDMGGYMQNEMGLGKEKALDMYKQYWLSILYHWFRDAKIELEIGKVVNLEELAKIINFCERKKFIPYQISGGGKQVTLTASDDPFAEITTKVMGLPLGASYLDAVASGDDAFINRIIADAKMSGKAKVTVKKRLVKGDDKNEIVIEQK